MIKKYDIFEFSKYTYDKINGVLKLFYRIDNFEFIEEINFNPNNLNLRNLTKKEEKALNLAFTYLHLVSGVSYYKLLLPKNIKINTITLNKDQKAFFEDVYFNGLGEFAFRNNLDLTNKIIFPHQENVENKGIDLALNENFIVPIGGGKDSIVTLEMLKKIKNKKLYTFSVNYARPIKDCCEISNCDHILVTRKISPLLLEINKDLEKYNAYNGHVPISSIIAFISTCVGIIYNCNTTAISNEKSANIGNILHCGTLVNHQWSKSFEAEKKIHDFIKKYITPNFNYISFLRPIYEIHIAKIFSKINKYNSVFSSCNKNFKVIKDDKTKKWCCDCDKCRFVFLILAPFISKNEMINIFGENILNDKNQLEGYLELVGLSKYKPFECVGEIEESITAFNLLKESEFKDDFVVKEINKKIPKMKTTEQLESLEKKYFDFDFKNSLLNEKHKKLLENFANFDILF